MHAVLLGYRARRVYYHGMGRDRAISDTMQLVRTAFKIIDDEGYDNFSARKLAEVMGVSHMTVYNYMDRDQLLSEVIIMGFSILNDRILPRVEACKADGGNPCRIFAYIAEELLVFAQAHSNIYRFMFQHRLGLAGENQRARHFYSSGIDFIKDMLPPDQRDAIQNDAYLFIVLVNGLILGYLGQRHSTTDQQCRDNMARAYELILGPRCACVNG